MSHTRTSVPLPLSTFVFPPTRLVLSLMLNKITREKARERERATKNGRLVGGLWQCAVTRRGWTGLSHHGLRSLWIASSFFHITTASFSIQDTRGLRRSCGDNVFPNPSSEHHDNKRASASCVCVWQALFSKGSILFCGSVRASSVAK